MEKNSKLGIPSELRPQPRRHGFAPMGMHELEDGNSRQACHSVGMVSKVSEVDVIQVSLDIKRLPSFLIHALVQTTMGMTRPTSGARHRRHRNLTI